MGILCEQSGLPQYELLASHVETFDHIYVSMVSCQKGPSRHAYAWQIGPFWQDTLDVYYCQCSCVWLPVSMSTLWLCLKGW